MVGEHIDPIVKIHLCMVTENTMPCSDIYISRIIILYYSTDIVNCDKLGATQGVIFL